MKRKFTIPILTPALILTLTLLVASPARAVDLNEEDKAMHAQACAGISMVSYGAFRLAKYSYLSAALMSFTMTMAIGHIKESTDPFYDKKDMQADAIGAGVGILIPLSFTF